MKLETFENEQMSGDRTLLFAIFIVAHTVANIALVVMMFGTILNDMDKSAYCTITTSESVALFGDVFAFGVGWAMFHVLITMMSIKMYTAVIERVYNSD